MIFSLPFPTHQLSKDLLHPSADEERRKHKLKRLVQSPNSYFMDVKCPGIVASTPVLHENVPTNPLATELVRFFGVAT